MVRGVEGGGGAGGSAWGLASGSLGAAKTQMISLISTALVLASRKDSKKGNS